MTNTEILTKAIEKAIDSGWDAWGWPDYSVWTDDYAVIFYDKSEEVDPTKMVERGNLIELNSIIFSHDFAKALWGTKIHQTSYEDFPEEWQYHLQQMVIAEDPIKYLGEHL